MQSKVAQQLGLYRPNESETASFQLLPWSELPSTHKHVNVTFTHTSDVSKLEFGAQMALKNVKSDSLTPELRALLADPELCQQRIEIWQHKEKFSPDIRATVDILKDTDIATGDHEYLMITSTLKLLAANLGCGRHLHYSAIYMAAAVCHAHDTRNKY